MNKIENRMNTQSKNIDVITSSTPEASEFDQYIRPPSEPKNNIIIQSTNESKQETQSIDETLISNNKISTELKNIFVIKNQDLPVPKVRSTSLFQQHSKAEYKALKQDDCAESRSLTRKWKNHFPKLTTEFEFRTKDHTCNYLFIITLLKLHQPELFGNINKFGVKTLLIEFYKEYIQDIYLKTIIIQKWKKQNKLEESKLLSKNVNISNIIHNETYPFTIIDMCLFMWHIRIPIILLGESKKSIRTLRFQHSEVKHNTFFFVRIGRLKKKFTFNLSKQTQGRIKIGLAQLKTDEIRKSIEENTLNNFEDYLLNKIKFN